MSWREALDVRRVDRSVGSLVDQVMARYREEKKASTPFYECAAVQVASSGFGDLAARSVTPQVAEAFFLDMVAEHGESAAGKIRAVLNAAFVLGRDQGALEHDPLGMLRHRRRSAPKPIHDVSKEVMTPSEIRAVLASSTSPFDRALWAFLLGSGLRFGEAAGAPRSALKIESNGFGRLEVAVQRSSTTGEIEPTKTKTVREVAIAPWVLAYLAAADVAFEAQSKLRAPERGLVFNFQWGWSAAPWSESSALRRWHGGLARAGLERRRLHSTRHTFISCLGDLGAPLTVIEDMTHTKKKGKGAFMGYLHHGFEKKCEAVALLEKAVTCE